MTERENVLARIREALRVPPKATAQVHVPTHGQAPNVNGQPRAWLPRVDSSPAAQMELFQKNAVDLKAIVHRVESVESASVVLARLRDEEGWKKAATHKGRLTQRLTSSLGVPLLVTNEGYDASELEQCDAGITECDALVAQTGSVLLTSRSAGGRALSALPPHHVVLATRDQLIPDLPEALALLRQRYGNDYPSFISFVTGPSRTGDIERILVLGAHGPKKLTIIVAEGQ